MKHCSKCDTDKDEKEFSKDKHRKDGLYNYCKECLNKIRRERFAKGLIVNDKEYHKQYYRDNKEKFTKYSQGIKRKEYLESPDVKAHSKEYQKQYYEKNKERILKRQNKHYKENKDKRKEYTTKPEVKARAKEYLNKYRQQPEVKEQIKIYHKNFISKNPDYPKEHQRKRLRNPINKLIAYQRSRLSKLLKNHSEREHTLDYIGCSPVYLYEHIEKQFTEGMTWENYGLWHVDHIIPCVSFDLTKEEERMKCFHYTNLQPLWAIDNLKKGASIPIN